MKCKKKNYIAPEFSFYKTVIWGASVASWIMSWWNKRVLRCFLKKPKVSQFRSSCGKLYHTQSAANENRRPPNTVLPRGTVSRSSVDQQSMHSGWYECSVSERYCSWFINRDWKHNVDSLNWILERTGNQCKRRTTISVKTLHTFVSKHWNSLNIITQTI